MDSIVIEGGVPLEGTIQISGAKNAALPLMVASLLSAKPLTLANVPRLADIRTMGKLLGHLGVEAEDNGQAGTLTLNGGEISGTTAPYDLVRQMRASALVLGPLVARFGEARVSLPGGCAIGTRLVDLHLMGLEALGAKVNLDDGYIQASAAGGLKGGTIRFPMVSVGATENLLMAASLAKGETVLENAAREPEVAELAHCLVAMGACIEGIGEARVVIKGVDELHGADYSIIPDRIETGSYAVAAAVTGGDLRLRGGCLEIMGAVADVLARAGTEIIETDEGIQVRRGGHGLKAVDLTTEPYPGFPTDMQAQMMVLASVAEGTSHITEAIFENRFMHVPELARMGASISVHGGEAVITGGGRLLGAPVMATDLRASMSLVLAGLVAEGETVISRVYHLDRGYERLEEKLGNCGARIRRVGA